MPKNGQVRRNAMGWFGFGKKKEKILDRKYWYVKENKIIKECDGQFYETDYIYDYYCFFDGMTYLLWIDSITSRSDDIIELQIGCINRENIRKDKTPLTIVRGNAELLSETELTTEQKNNITYVLNGTTQIQSYVKQLIDVTKSWNCSDVTYTTVRLEDFFADIKEQALGLVEIYHQKIDWKAGQSDKKVTIAYDPMFRAVMNMIQNAVEHTKENGIIYIDAKEQDGRLTFIVEDSGSGFTKEALLHGTEQFFMDDTSRNGEAHYGMGLFFAKTVAEKYGGGIKLSNSENTGGARVEIFFLSSQETS